MRLKLLYEADGRIVNFKYDSFKTDPRPRVFLMGRWQHPTTNNTLVAGINLNYLDDAEIEELKNNSKEILKPHNLKSKYWKGRELLPKIFEKYYRTYNQDNINSVTRDAIKFFKPDELDKKQEEPKVTTDKEEPTPEPQKIKQGSDVEQQIKRDKTPDAKVEPELDKETTEQRSGVQPDDRKTKKPEKPSEPSRPQSALSPEEIKVDRAQKLKDAADKLRKTKDDKKEPPDDIKGVLGMFK
jgi:hypothetical protein